MATYTVDTAADIASQNGAARWWDALLAGALPPSSSTTGGGSVPTSLQGLFGANAPTGPALPAGTVSPLSTLFSQIPTGLANSTTSNVTNPAGEVIKGYIEDQGNPNIQAGGSPHFLPVGQQMVPKQGQSIIYGVHKGQYGYYQIPTADLPNAENKYGISVNNILSPDAIAYYNNPKGGPNQITSGAASFDNTGKLVLAGSGGGGGTVTTGGGGGTNTTTGGGGGTNTTTTTNTNTTTTPQLPELTGGYKTYLDKIDAYIRSQRPYATIDDSLRRAFNLPGMAELQMNMRANPQADPNNFIGNPAGNPFTPGAAPPQGFKWYWADPDDSGPNPGNYTLVPQENFFNALPGTNLDDLQQLVNVYNDPSFANKYTPTSLSNPSLLGDWGRFLNLKPQGSTGPRASLAPQESISQLAPFMQRSDLYAYFNSLLNSVAGRLGPNYAPNYNVFNDVNDPTRVGNYFNSVNDALGLAGLPSLKDVLGGGNRQLGNDQFYGGKSLDFYSPQEKAPAFFQYLLGDFDGASGPNPQTYALRMKGNPDTQFDAKQVLDILNNPKYRQMIPSAQISNINPNIFSQTLNTSGDAIWTLLNSYKFPGGAGGPGTGGTQNQSTGAGAAGGPGLQMERWMPSGGADINDPVANRQQFLDQQTKAQKLYGGGDGTAGLGTTPPPTTPPPASGNPSTPSTTNPFDSITAPYKSSNDRPPAFSFPYTMWT